MAQAASFAPLPVSYQRHGQPIDGIFSASPPTDAPPPRHRRRSARRPKYRGSFSTSICSLFSRPDRRSDCCSVALCGVLAADRNRYLLLGALPPPWWRRLLVWVALPLALWVADRHVLDRMLSVQMTARCQAAFPDDGTGPHLDALNGTYFGGGAGGEKDQVYADVTGLQTAHMVLFLSFLFVASILLAGAASRRVGFRTVLTTRLYEMDGSDNGTDGTGEGEGQIQAGANVLPDMKDNRSATKTCGCYRAPDMLHGLEDDEDSNREANPNARGDLCTCLWQFVSTLFCRGCCGCWCQCCGICATAQEDREISTLVPRDKLRMDYLTFQAFAEYGPSLEHLRQIRDGSIVSHWRLMSELATMLMRWIGIILLGLGVYALTDIDSHFTLANLVVVLATLLQSFLLLYFVHWKWHRFDLSLDAVVKYFAAGFLFSTSTAFIVEMLVSAAVAIVAAVLGIIAVAFEIVAGELDDETDPKDMIKIIIRDNAWLGVLFMFMNAFAVAATTEELCKYFGFWMVEHPDLLTEDEEAEMPGIQVEGQGDKDFAKDDSAEEDTAVRPHRDLNGKGVGITVGMVSVAVGFACCENLKYVFSSTDIETEMGTLLARSIFPVHALAAAIQSIGVCRRDLEGDKSVQLGRLILPAVILHGCFDFFLMVSPVLMLVNHADDIITDGDDAAKEEEAQYNAYVKVCQQYGAINEEVWQPTDDSEGDLAMTQSDSIITGVAFGLSILSVIIGTIYYIVQSRKQKVRLDIIDNASRQDAIEGSTLGLV